jgi:hypothetical protein
MPAPETACEQLTATLAANLAEKATTHHITAMIARSETMARSASVMERVIGVTDLIVLRAALALKAVRS